MLFQNKNIELQTATKFADIQNLLFKLMYK